MSVVVQPHKPSHPAIDLKRGDTVSVGRRDDEWPAFRWCAAQAGEGWIPEEFIDLGSDPPEMNRDYTTRELEAQPGDEVTVLERSGGWAFGTLRGKHGWIPERCLRE